MKKLATPIIILCVVVAGVFVLRSCKFTDKYKQMKLQYEEYRAIAKADNDIQRETIREANKIILDKTAEIRELENTVKQKDRQVRVLSNQLDELKDAEPSQPELENEPLVINLRLQIARLTEMFNLSQNVIAEKDKIILAWEVKYNALERVSEAWRNQYENEAKLRGLAEGLVANLEGQVRRANFKSKVLTVAVVAVGAYAGYRLVKAVSKD